MCVYISNVNVCEFNSQWYQELLWVNLVNVKHLKLSLCILDCWEMDRCSCPDFLRVFLRLVRLVEACHSLDKLVIKVRINLSI